ncbi:MAG: hypothetical protein JWP23_1232 [Phenylobacterium sp.]|nr:hypothetical protein [Phenylobacterium sp.]
MKTPHLVLYDYGAGGVWAIMIAESIDAIAGRFPLLKVVGKRPPWMDEALYEQLPRYDIGQEPDDFLRALAIKRR